MLHAISFALYLLTVSLYLLAYQMHTIWDKDPVIKTIFFAMYGFYKIGIAIAELFFCAIVWKLGEKDDDEDGETQNLDFTGTIEVEEMDDSEALN